MASIVAQLKTIRDRAKLSHEAVGRKMGVSRVQALRIEAGQSSTPIQNIEAWADACGHDLVFVDRAAPGVEVLAAELAWAKEEERALLLRISRILPLLDARMRRIFDGQIEMFQEEAEELERNTRNEPPLKVIGD